MHTDPPTIVRSSAEAAHLLAPSFAGATVEKIAVLHIDAEGRVLVVREYVGGADEAELPIRVIVAEALRLDTQAVVVAHNHPSGDPTPSAEDLRVSRLLADTLRNLGIQLADHLIFAGNGVRSLRELGLL